MEGAAAARLSAPPREDFFVAAVSAFPRQAFGVLATNVVARLFFSTAEAGALLDTHPRRRAHDGQSAPFFLCDSNFLFRGSNLPLPVTSLARDFRRSFYLFDFPVKCNFTQTDTLDRRTQIPDTNTTFWSRRCDFWTRKRNFRPQDVGI